MLALTLSPLIENHPQWWAAGAIVVLGLFVYGLSDVLRFSLRRVWAIASVCVAESYRKKVLLITPLAILGVIVVSQFQKPIDEADAVRQTLKVCLFATGMVVTIVAVILACTNLPKEIENRVIYTVVTKPTTRLELVLGKIAGFSLITGAILVIMGLFTAVYLAGLSARLTGEIAARLASPDIEASIKPTLEYYRDTGLLAAREVSAAHTLQILARDPAADSDSRWVLGGEGDVLVPFDLTPELLTPAGDPTAPPGSAGVVVDVRLGFDPKYRARQRGSELPVGIAAPTTSPAVDPVNLAVSVLDRLEDTLVGSNVIDQGKPIQMSDPAGDSRLQVWIPPQAMDRIDRWTRVNVLVTPVSSGAEYRVFPDSVRLLIPGLAGAPPKIVQPSASFDRWGFRGRQGRVGAQVRGGEAGRQPTHVAVFRFSGATATPDLAGLVPFEFRSDIERSDVDDRDESPTTLEVVVRSRKTGKDSAPVRVLLEANRPIFFKIPAKHMDGGDFDVLARCVTPGHYLGVTRSSLAVIRSNQGFLYNLCKSLLVMWTMAVLVIMVSIFSSTFLSWPIAVVLTLVLLLGRWGVVQLGDALAPGIGNQVATDLGFRDPSLSTTVSKTVEALARLLNVSAKVLPDISRFASIEDLERGLALPLFKLRESLAVLLTFGLPVMVLSYVFLRNKEVAP